MHAFRSSLRTVRVPASLFWLGLFALLPAALLGQQIKFYPTEAPKFVEALTSDLNQSKEPAAKTAAADLLLTWNSGKLTEAEKEKFISLTNVYLSRQARIFPDLTRLSSVFAAITQGLGTVTLDKNNFLDVSMETISTLDRERSSRYLANLEVFVREGYLAKRAKFGWKSSEKAPQLSFLKMEDEKGSYQAPTVRFSLTDLSFASDRDSFLIGQTMGEFNLLSQVFLGTKGKVSWEKLGLSKDDVYCELADYQVNCNYSQVVIDSVTFHYKSLIDRPLKGRFEDANIGHKDRSTANYPYFTSYEGGVVIENFVPNVRYEGGFSLQGLKKIGSSYTIWVDAPEPETTGDPEVDSWLSGVTSADLKKAEEIAEAESEWDYTAASSPFTSDTDYSYYEETPFEDQSIYEPALPEKVQEKVLAKIEIQRSGQVAMRLRGNSFVLGLDRLVAPEVAASVYFEAKDSLYHPGLDLVYTVEDSTVILKKPRKGSYRSVPFENSYHEYFLYFETIIWPLGDDEVQFTAFIDRENKVGAIESYDYFTKARFDQFKNILKFNPIGAIYRYWMLNPKAAIFPSSITDDNKTPDQLPALIQALPALEGSGFIRYDKTSKQIFPQEKLKNWGMAARNKKDYDAIQLIAKVDTGAHAVMRLDDREIELRGVRYFSLSDSVYVRVVPLEEHVYVQKDRNLRFGGAVAAGKLNFYAMDEDRLSFTFDYDGYKIVCDSIDSVRFVLVRNAGPDYQPTPLEQALAKTVFEGITGAIYIDDPGNKNGQQDFAEFPVFDSYGRSYVYWAKPEVQGGVYAREKMNFSVDPFMLDSLETFDPNALTFDGQFYSSEILPAFRQRLQVMDDFTLGFKHQAPPSGLQVYGNKGRFYDEIVLDGQGLQGKGSMEYLGTVAKSDSFVLHFDSCMAQINSFNLRRGYRGGVYFPQVDATSGNYKWFTKKDELTLSSTYEAFSVFNGEAKFTGKLSITPKGMVGDGVLVLGEVMVTGDSIVFNEMDFKANGAEFAIIDPADTTKKLFVASDVTVAYDVWRHKSTFETRDVGKALAVFNNHQYATSLAKGLFQRSTKDLKLEGVSSYARDNFFVSIDPKQDSLRFNAKSAYYSLQTRDVVVSGVPYIYVADAMITPDRQEVVIQENGLTKPLKNALVEADQTTKFHRIYQSEIQIFGRNEYEGGGKYDYIEVNGKRQFIQFNNIKVNSDTTTVASGPITESEQFYLTERILFRGNAQLDASRKFLSFEGEVKIESENPVFKGAWFTFEKTIVNPDSIFIPIDKRRLVNADNEQLSVGLNFVPDSRVFYSTFLQVKDDPADPEIITAAGGLTFDRKRKEFKIGSEKKIKNQTFRGSTVSFNDIDNTITSQGLLNFPYAFPDKTLRMKMSGSWKDDLKKRQLTTNLLMGVDYGVLPPEVFSKVSSNLLFLTAANKDIDFNQQAFLEGVSELLDEGKEGERETAKFLDNVRNAMVYTDIKLSRQLPYTVLLSGVNYKYSFEKKALWHDGEVGLVGLGGNPINKKINAKIVYLLGTTDEEGRKSPDRLTMYLEVDEFNWLYFEFDGEVLRTVSSFYDDYNAPIQALIDKRKSNEGYRFELISEDDVIKFRQEFVLNFIK